MKRALTKFIVLGTFVLAIVFSLGIEAKAAVNVLKSFKYDYNTVLGFDTNYHGHRYKNVPDNAYYSHQNSTKVG